MGKKKLSLKRKSPSFLSFELTASAVNRGFATTSVQSKKAKEQEAIVKSADQVAPVAQQDKEKPHNETLDETPSQGPSGNGSPSKPSGPDSGNIDDWESEQAINDSFYQDLVDRLQDKADKEVARIIKV